MRNAETPPTMAARNGKETDAVRTGIVRHIDQLGRIVIPSEIRKKFGLGDKDPVEISVRGEEILLSHQGQIHAPTRAAGRSSRMRRLEEPS